MHVCKRRFRGRKTGKTKTCRNWTVRFKDHLDIERRFPAFADKKASEELGRRLENLVALRVAGGQPDPATTRWIETLAPKMRERLARIGLLERERLSGAKPLTVHLADFRAFLAAKGNTPRYVDLVAGRARRVLEGCGFRYYSDIVASRVQQYLADLRRDGAERKGISAQTFNFYLQAIKQFCRWMVKDRRASGSPLSPLDGLNVRTDRRHDRRALTVDECCKLLATTRGSTYRFGMSGEERAMLYQLALTTGLRQNELRSLTRSSFDLDADSPTVTVQAAYSKHRREDTLPLRADTAAALREFLAYKHPNARVFNLPSGRHAGEVLQEDLKAAGIPYRDSDGRVVDFHGLRHTFITNLANSGVHPAVAKALARHCTIALTLDRYTHTLQEQRTEALAKLPDITKPPAESQAATMA